MMCTPAPAFTAKVCPFLSFLTDVLNARADLFHVASSDIPASVCHDVDAKETTYICKAVVNGCGLCFHSQSIILLGLSHQVAATEEVSSVSHMEREGMQGLGGRRIEARN